MPRLIDGQSRVLHIEGRGEHEQGRDVAIETLEPGQVKVSLLLRTERLGAKVGANGRRTDLLLRRHAVAIAVEAIAGPGARGRQVELVVAVRVADPDECLEAGVAPQLVRAFLFGHMTGHQQGANVARGDVAQADAARAGPAAVTAHFDSDCSDRGGRGLGMTFELKTLGHGGGVGKAELCGKRRVSGSGQGEPFRRFPVAPHPCYPARAMTYTSDLLRLLDERGYIHQLTDAEGLDALAAKGAIAGYVGFDATAPSLHVGHMIQLMLLRRLQQAGHKPIVLVGGGTSKIGDPSFKDEARKLITTDQIADNIRSIMPIYQRFLRFGDGPSDAVLMDNAEWLDRLEYIPFLRDIGQHFSVNRMLSFDSVKLRLDREQSLSFLEFNYMILQAYDFLELSRRSNCVLQLGGSDQWGNIVNGVELGRRVDGKHLHGVTTPLLTTADGKKMGKTEAGAVWLNAEQLSPYDFWQFWRNSHDADVGKFLRLFTDVPLDEIARLESLEGNEINLAKKVLADQVTALVHGDAAAEAAAETARKTFEEGSAGESLPTLKVEGEISLVDALIGLGMVGSKNEARRLIAQGGAKVNGEKIDTDVALAVTGEVRISAGKKKHGLLTS